MSKILSGILVLIGIVVIGGAIYYFTSDVGKTKITEAHQQYATWTNENIVANPVLYLDYCEQQAKSSLEKLSVSDLTLSQQKTKLTTQRDSAFAKIREGDKALSELKSLYGSGISSWPTAWRGQSLSEDEFTQQVKTLVQSLNIERKRLDFIESGLTKAVATQTSVAETRATLKNQISELSLQREMVKIQQINDDLATQIHNVGAMIQSTASLASDLSSGNIRSLETIVSQAQDDSVFRKAMGLE